MDVQMSQLIQIGLGRPIAASIAEACERIKTIENCWQITLPTMIEQDGLMIRDESHVLRSSMVTLLTNKKVWRCTSTYLWEHGLQLYRYGDHAVAIYDRSFEDEFVSSSNCFHVESGNTDCRSVSTADFLHAVMRKAKCGLHGFMSASAVAHGIRQG